ncbi:hypothetical protein Tco_0314704, partial [Tanacetum coccineum]
ISDLAYKYAGTSSDISSPSRCTDFILLVCELKAVSVTTEHLAVDLEQFAIHGDRSSVNIADVILSDIQKWLFEIALFVFSTQEQESG